MAERPKKQVILALVVIPSWLRIDEGTQHGLDQNHPEAISPRWTALCKRYDRQGVDFVERTAAEAGSLGPPTSVERSHRSGCDFLHSCDRLPMARVAKRLPAVHDSSVLLLQLA